jgi:hypothetical protein
MTWYLYSVYFFERLALLYADTNTHKYEHVSWEILVPGVYLLVNQEWRRSKRNLKIAAILHGFEPRT